MIIFWILTLFVGSSAFAFAYIYLHSLWIAGVSIPTAEGPYHEELPMVPERPVAIAGSA